MAGSDNHNHLSGEASPYLEQHVDNPVDWYPWGEEAFQKAKYEDKPIFLSIGYATCHWCHVMEAESFEDDLMAQMLNDTFVNVKVDREELPGVDSLYMEYAQAMLGGAAGWPLNVVLTPDLKPFFAATYMPKDGDVEQIGFKEVIRRIHRLWHSEERSRLIEQAEDVMIQVEEESELEGEHIPVEDLLDGVFELIYQLSDPTYGGFQGAPKFPMGYQVSLLLRAAKYRGDGRALFCADKSLEMMYRGGIYDHLGGGVARYCVDHRWMVPHFEKMCVDNALVASAYVEGWQMTETALYRAVAEDVFSYLLREMQDREGGFYSAEDADSEGKEGVYYTWTAEEIYDVLGQAEADLVVQFFGVTLGGNFEEGRSILHIPHRIEEFAKRTPFSSMELAERISIARTKLLESREQRIRPIKDDKVVAGWNGLTMRALADGYLAFGAKRYLDAAVRCAQFIKRELWDGKRLVRRWRNGHAGKPACLEDYAFLISGLLNLFRVDGGSDYLAFAIELANVISFDFAAPDGTFYRTDGRDKNLIVRQIDLYDGAEPSGLAVHAENLLRLHQITSAERYKEEAAGILGCSEALLQSHPLGGGYHCLSLMRSVAKKQRVIVVALNESGDLKQEILNSFGGKFIPNTEIIWRNPNDLLLQQLIPSVKGQGPVDGKTALYICEEGVCHPPVTDPQEILTTIK